MNPSNPEHPLLVDLAGALRRQWLAALMFFLLSMAVVTGGLIVAPRKYESEGIFYVRIGRGGLSLDPTATTSKQVNIQESQQTEINSVGALLASRGMAEQVADKVGVDRILETGRNWLSRLTEYVPSLPSLGEAASSQSVDAGMDYAVLKRREKAVRMLLQDIRIRPTRKAATISIACRAATPVLARDLVKVLMDEYLEAHLRANRTEGAYDFFNEQLTVQEKLVARKMQEIRDFKDANQMTTIEGEQASLQHQIDEFNARLIDANGQLAAQQRRVEELQSQYDLLDERLVTEVVEGTPNEGSDLMRDRLYALQIQEKELLAKFSPDHPQVIMVRDQLREARRVYSAQPADRKQVTSEVNPTRLKLHTTLLNAIADHRSVQAQAENLTATRQAVLQQLTDVNRKEAILAQMQRELDVARMNYRTYAEKLEESRIGRELDLVRISNVKVVQEPGLVLKPVSPKRLLILAASSVALLAASVLVAHARDANRPKPSAQDAADQYLNLPVLTKMEREAGESAVR
jgi:uncharacterized protein involved in exopolysaccharide biosynthesis